MTNRTLVVSIDALITADIPVLKQLPNLGRVMEHASWITDSECIYPTLTYPKGTDGLVLVAGGHSGAYRGGFCKTGGADCLYRHLARHVRLRSGVQYWRDLGPPGGG